MKSAISAKRLKIWMLIAFFIIIPCFQVFASNGAGNIHTTEKFAWSESAGWINTRTINRGISVYETYIAGYAWGENIGWINLGASNSGPYTNTSSTNWGVNMGRDGSLSGYGWSENAGWIKFNPEHGLPVLLDKPSGIFSGYAWCENIGYIKFRNISPAYNVITPRLSISDEIVEENAGNVSFTVSMTPATDIDVDVRYKTFDGTSDSSQISATAANDYEESFGTARLYAGETSKKIDIPIQTADTQQEPTEYFTLQLYNPSGASLNKSNGICKILDDDGHTVSFTVGEHGNISTRTAVASSAYQYTQITGPNLGTVLTNHKDRIDIQITPDSGYEITSLIVNNQAVSFVGTGMVYTILDVREDYDISVSFTDSYYDVTIDPNYSNGYCVVTYGSATNIPHGSSRKIKCTPETNYHLDLLNVCGDNISLVGYGTKVIEHEFSVVKDCTVLAQFEIDRYTIKASTQSGVGSITPIENYYSVSYDNDQVLITVDYNTNPKVRISPEGHHHIQDVNINGQSVLSNCSFYGELCDYTFESVQSNYTMAVAFEGNTYTLAMIAGDGGYIQYTNSSGNSVVVNDSAFIAVEYDSTQSILVYPDAGFHVANVDIDGQPQERKLSSPAVFTFSQIRAHHAIRAIFSNILVTQYGDTKLGTFFDSISYPNIQNAVNSAADGQVIAVDPGVYDVVDFSGKNINLTIFSTQGPEVTFIDGKRQAKCLTFDANSTTIKFSGFTIQNGLSTQGGGIYINNTSPIINDCRIINNEATETGGGIFVSENSAPQLSSLYIRGNIAGQYGGGLFCESKTNISSPLLFQSIIRDNSAGENGGGIYINGYSAAAHAFIKISSVWIVQNKSRADGAGIYVNKAEADIFASTISNNAVTDGYGSGIYVLGSAHTPQVTIKNSILWGNGREIDGNKDIIAVTYSNIEVESGVYGSIADNNRRIDPVFANSTIGDYHLTKTSRCIDVGSPNFPSAAMYQHDIDGRKRVYGTVVDLGGDEWKNTTPQIDFSANVTSGYSPLTVQFTNLTSNPDDTTLKIWEFGDGSISNEDSPTHIYKQSGLYTVQLTVYESSGYSATRTRYDYIKVDDSSGKTIIADFIAAPSDQSLDKTTDVVGVEGYAPFTVQFRNLTAPDSIAPPASKNTPWMWDFGDGDTSDLESPLHQYSTPGTYTVKLMVYAQGNEGETLYKNRIRYAYVTVLDPMPQASFEVVPAECAVSSSVCTVTVYDRSFSYSDIVKWTWAFGDGSTVEKTNNPHHTHVYTNIDTPKTLNISLTVTNVDDKTDTTTQTIDVKTENIFNVPDDYTSIQDAINAVTDGLWTSLKITILVEQGVYYENLDLKSKVLTIKAKDGHEVIIDGKSSDSVIKITGGQTRAMTLEGLTIQNGKAEYGAGILVDTSSSPVIRNCRIINNQATIAGGGIAFLNESGGVIENTVIGKDAQDMNIAPYGAGIACLYGASPLIIGQTSIGYNAASINGGGIYAFANANPVIIDTLINSNKASNGQGGGIYASQAEPRIESSSLKYNQASLGAGIVWKNSNFPITRRCYIQGNVAGVGGGGIYAVQTIAPQVINTLIADNRATNGAGLYLNKTSSANILFSTIANNTSVSGTGCGVYGVDLAPGLMVLNSIFKNQGGDEVVLSTSEAAQISNSAIVQTEYIDDTNTSENPKFIIYGTSNPNYQLNIGSPCQNTAKKQTNVHRDLAGNSRYIGSGSSPNADMGAFEAATWPITILYEANGKVVGPDSATIASGALSGIDHQGSKAYTIMPLTGYKISNVRVDGLSVLDQMTADGVNMTYTFTNVTASHTFQADFSRYSLTVSIKYKGDTNNSTTNSIFAEVDMTAQSEGLLKNWPLPGVVQQLTVYYGSSLTLTAVPAMTTDFINFSTGQLIGNSSVLISNITESMSVTATFALKKYNIVTIKAGDGQGVINTTASQVKFGENVTLSAVPDANSSQFDGWSGFISGTNASVGIDDVHQDITVTGTFNLKTLSLQIRREGSGGSLNGYLNTSTNITDLLGPPDIDNPNGKSFSIKYGDDLKLSAIYPGSWKFDGWTWTGDNKDTQSTHEWVNIQTDLFVTANFSQNNISVTILRDPLATGSGEVYVNDIAQSLPSTITVSYGGMLVAKAVADTYSSVFSGWSGHASGTGNAVLTNITSNKTINANFQLKQFSIIASATNGGSINPTGMSTVAFGKEKTYTFKPDGTDAYLSDLLIDGVSKKAEVGQTGTYSFTDISANHTIVAIFNRQIQVGSGGQATIQKAIDLSEDGDTVLVKPGIYEENINFRGKAVRVVSEEPFQAIIDGKYITNVVRFVSNEPAGAILSGFIIRNGTSSTGGGIYIDNASPTIENCRIEDNSAVTNGGGIFITGASQALVISTTVLNNTSGGSGGGIYCYQSSPTLSRSVITNNDADLNGGGVFIAGTGYPTLVNMVIYDNLAKYNGGGIYVETSSIAIRHCTVSDNQSGQGVALFVDKITSPAQVLVQNSIFWQSNAQIFSVIDADETDAIQVTGSNIYVKNGSYPGTGNIKQNPLFANISTGNYRIKNGSPCINSGLDLSQDVVTIDHDGYPRPYSNEVDMGAFEWNDSVLHVDIYASKLSGSPGLTVQFKGYAFSSLAGYVWDWDFGNSTTSSLQNPITVTYSQPGTYKVRLTVTDNDNDPGGQTLTREKVIIVKEKPIADFIASTTSGFAPLRIEFTDTSQSYQTLVEWEWSFGDGAQDFRRNPTYVYTISGVYTVKFMVKDNTNEKDTAIKYQYIRVMDGIPDVNFSAKKTLGNAPLKVEFFDTTLAYQDLVSWTWNFGDSTTSKSKNPVHTYTIQGDYTVSLEVKDQKGSFLKTKNKYIHVVGSGKQLEVCDSGCDYYKIQDAIDGANDGDVITVYEGAYSENISFKGKNIKLVSQKGPNVTTISGLASGGSVVTFDQGESSGAVLQGFTLINGKAPYGGGILIANSSSPCISNCTIKNNTATKGGGGIAVLDEYSEPNLLGIQLFDNTAPYGGGIASINKAAPYLRSAYISHNFAEDSGGGIYLFAGATLKSEKVTIDDNTADNYGGGVFLNKTTAILRQMTISNNDATYGSGLAMWANLATLVDQCRINNNRPAEKGGGFYAADSESPEIRNTVISNNDAISGGGVYFSNVSAPFVHFSTIADNHASGTGNGIHVFSDQPDASPLVNVRSSILWNGGDEINHKPGDGMAMVTYSNIADADWQVYSGNMNSDPLFTNDETYHLAGGSPCKNRASEENAPISDIDGDTRPLGKGYEGIGMGYDMGADESTNAPPVAETRTENVLEDLATVIQLMATDEDGDDMTYNIFQQPAKGQLIGTGASRTYKPNANYNGPDSFSFKVNDGRQDSNEAIVYINVLPVNDRPEFNIDDNISVYENGGLTRIENWVKEINAGASGHTNESSQMITFKPTADKPELFSLQPSIANNGTITFTPAPNAIGTAIITVFLEDDGGTTNNGSNISQNKYFSIQIIDVNDAPTFTINPDYSHISVWEDAITQNISQFAENISPGSETELSQRVWFEVSTKQTYLFKQLPTIHENGTLTFIPQTDANGTATLTIYLKDDGGTNASGRDTSDPSQCVIDILAVNDKPNFTPGPEISVYEDASAQIFPSWAGNPSPGASDESSQILTYILESDFPDLFLAGPSITSSGTLTFTPAPNANGTANITVRVQDNGGTDYNGQNTSNPKNFEIKVIAVNDNPSFVPMASTLTFQEDSGKHDLEWATQISAGAPNESGQTLTFHVTTNQQSMFDYPPTIWSTNGFLSFTLKQNAFGKAVVSVYLEDSFGSRSTMHELTINITEINDVPSFNMNAQMVIVEDSGEQRILNWVDNINPGPDSQANAYPFNEIEQPIAFLVQTTNNDLFTRLPSISSDGTLVLETSPNASGSAVVTVTLEDEGTTNGALDKKQSLPKSFNLSVTPVNDSPSFTIGQNIEIYEDSPQQVHLKWAKNILAGPANETDQTLSFSTSSNNPNLFTQQPTISIDGDIVFTPKPNASGLAVVSVVLKDSGGLSNDGQDTSPTQQFTINIIPLNDAPSFSLGPDISISEDAGLKEYVNWITQINAGGGTDESSQKLTFHVGVQGGNDLFVKTPEVIVEDGIGSLLFEPLANANGEKMITIFLEDSGTTENGGVNTSPTQFLTIKVLAVNDQPTFDLAKQTLTVLEDAGMQSIPSFGLNINSGPPDENGQPLTFHLSVNNETLFSTPPQMTPEGTLSFQTAPDQSGDATVTIYLNDGQSENNTSNSKTFIISVTNINDEPSFTIGPDQSIKEDSRPQQIAAWATNINAGASNEAAQRLTFNLEPSNTSLFLVQPQVRSDGMLIYTPAPNAFGTAEVRITLLDDGGTQNNGDNTSSTKTFNINLRPVNDRPSFIKGPNISVEEDSGQQHIVGWASAVTPGPLNEYTQELEFIISTNNDSMFESMPHVDAYGNLTFKSAADAFGSASVRLYLRDNGGISDGGINESIYQEFTLTINPVNDAPSYDAGGDVLIYEDASNQVITNWAKNISAGAPNEDQLLTFRYDLENSYLFSSPPEISQDGTLMFTTAQNENGVAKMTLWIEDDTKYGAKMTSTKQTFRINIMAVNDKPTFQNGPDQTVFEDSGNHVVTEWASAISAGASNEAGQSLSFHVTTDNQTLFQRLPEITPEGDLSFQPAANVWGTATVILNLIDNGGVVNGGRDVSDTAQLTIKVLPVNDAPGFTKGPNQFIVEEAPLQNVPNWASNINSGPPDESDQNIIFMIDVDKPELFETTPTISEDGRLSYKPALDSSGIATLTVKLKDSGGTANGGVDTSPEQTFTITIDGYNDPPRFVKGTHISVPEDSPEQIINAWATQISAGGPGEESQILEFVVSVDDESLFETLPEISPAGTLTFKPRTDQFGETNVAVYLIDDGPGSNMSTTQEFNITIIPINDRPTFIRGENIIIFEDRNEQSIPNWVTNIKPGPWNEESQTLTFQVIPDDPSLFASGPYISETGKLTYTPALNRKGDVSLRVYLKDNGGTENGGQDTSEPQDFHITMIGVNDPPSFSLQGSQHSVLEDSGRQMVSNWAANILPGPSDESDQNVFFRITNNNTSLFSEQPVISPNGILTYKPAPDASGEVKVLVFLEDDGGTANGGINVSATKEFIINIIGVNDPPAFTKGADQRVDEDSGAKIVSNWAQNISPGAISEIGQTLTFFLEVSNPNLFAYPPEISSVGTLTFTPAPNSAGIAYIDVTLKDDGGIDYGGDFTSDVQEFKIEIIPSNDPPTFTAGSSQVVLENSGEQIVAQWATEISAGAIDEKDQILTFHVETTNTDLFTRTPEVNIDGTLHYMVKEDVFGTASVKVTLKDNGSNISPSQNTSDTKVFNITIQPVNDPPSFIKGVDQVVVEDAGEQRINNWAKEIVPGPDNESLQMLTFEISTDNDDLFAVYPTISTTSGTLIFQSKPNMSGIANVSIRLKDDGGTNNGGIDTSTIQVFTISVYEVNDQPTFSSGPDQLILEDAGQQQIANWAKNISAGPPNESGQLLTFHVNPDNESLFAILPEIDAYGKLTYTPKNDIFGSTLVSVYLQDNGGLENGGNNTSAMYQFTIHIQSVNDAPSFTPGNGMTVIKSSGLNSHQNWATNIIPGPSNESGQSLTFYMTTSGESFIFSQQPTLSPTGTLSFVVENGRYGTANISVYLKDDGGSLNNGSDRSPTIDFNITVIDANAPPTFVKGADQVVPEDSGEIIVSTWASQIDPGAPDETHQNVQFMVSVDKQSLFTVLPHITPEGQLSFTPAPDLYGQASITTYLMDDGGTANGGDNTSDPQNFKIVINAVNDLPEFRMENEHISYEDDDVQVILNWAYDIKPGPSNESSQALSFLVTTEKPEMFLMAPEIMPSGALRYQAALNESGESIVTVRLKDDGGRDNGGQDTSNDLHFKVTIRPKNDPPVNTVQPWITGVPFIGQILTAHRGEWNDNIDKTPGSLTYMNQWQRANDMYGSGLTDINGQTQDTLEIIASDSGKYIRLKVTAWDDGEGFPVNLSNDAYSRFMAIGKSVADVDGNGQVDVTDAILSIQALSNISSQTPLVGGDIDGDGKIGLADIIYLLVTMSQ
ncbi:secreted protein containing PKD domain protein [Candidatus Magnetomorum sp. HK-1]|nr:secreted protein containing PKD domain protein [Candidatus Magnetomorum sp. HK-1]